MNTDVFRERLRQAIKSESISSFARKSGVPESSIRGYLEDKMPGLDKAAAMARAAGVSLDWLCGFESSVSCEFGDLNRLLMALEAVEQGLEAANRRMEPSKKAELIMVAYELLADAKEETKAQIIRFVRAA